MPPRLSDARLTLRPAESPDFPSIAAIYASEVLNGTSTFETEAPIVEEIGRRHRDVVSRGLPWLVAECAGEVAGYAYANLFRPRQAYRYTVEDSIYLLPLARGRGIGRLLLAELIARCEAVGCRQMLAVVGDSGNRGSLALHRALGFEPVGTFRDVGRKFDRWLDVALLQRPLGPGSTAPAGD